MISFTKKNRSQNTPESDYNGNDSYNGYSDYSSDYVSSDFGDEVNDEAPAEYTEPTLVDKKPEEDLSKSTIKLINFTTPADREKVAEALKDGCAVILDLTDLTRIVVTHSLDENLLKRYDRILTLKNGSIAEFGSFDELMEKKGYFYSLFTVSQ